MRRFVAMAFDIAAAHTHRILELPAQRVEDIANGQIRIFVAVVGLRVRAGVEIAAGKRDMGMYLIAIALAMTMLGEADDHIASLQVWCESLEFFDVLLDLAAQGRRWRHALKCDGNGKLHDGCPACDIADADVAYVNASALRQG
jgi:type IV secretory pathway VirB2 component (pilin)